MSIIGQFAMSVASTQILSVASVISAQGTSPSGHFFVNGSTLTCSRKFDPPRLPQAIWPVGDILVMFIAGIPLPAFVVVLSAAEQLLPSR